MNTMNYITVIVLVNVLGCSGIIEHIPMPGGMADCFARYSEKTNVVDTVGESIASFCFGQYMWHASKELGLPGFNISREAYSWVQSLLKPTQLRHKRQNPEIRIRKEYRRLTEIERNNFHVAVQMLKADRSVPPSMYDALSAIHQGMVTTSAHGGPNFLGFHRVYLLLYENALRAKIPSVTVPYWDSTLDEPLINPTQSIIFTDRFMGNGFGMVNSGPFAGWTTLSGPLIRNTGQSGQLFNINDMARTVSSLRLAIITEPMAPVNSSLEFLHNQVHLWIDGQMGNLETAAHDPIFWLHHSYVDYVWELFRQNQRRFGIDPQADYPTFVNHTMHMAMWPLGLAGLRNIDGLSDSFTTMIYQYEPSPTCSLRFPDCGSPYLRCVMVGFQPRCVSIDWTGSARVSNFAQQQFINAAIQTQQMQIMAGGSLMGPGFLQQAQMRMVNPMAIPNRISIPQGEQEGTGLDDASELPSHMQRRRRRYFKERPSHHIQRRTVKLRERQYFDHLPLKARPADQHDPRGSAFMKNTLNINSNLQIPALLPEMHQNMPSTVQNASTGTFLPPNMPDMCPAIPMTQGYQNTFNINGRSDIKQWVYIPVKVIYQRPPTYTSYTSYPIVNGEVEAEDIYSPNAFASMRQVMPMGKPASYHNCMEQESGAGKVYISSQGLNYMGTYKEYAIVDHRLAISIATAYVAVKSPEFGASQVFLNAYDSCGRICQPFCKMAGAGGFQRCSGAFRVTSGMPKMYGTNYGDAVTHLWQFSKTDVCPTMQDDNIYIQFHCNFRESWPFGMQPPQTGNLHSQSVIDELEEPEIPGGSGANTACNIGNGCVITTGCDKCVNGAKYPCIGACSMYTSCQNGVHNLFRCPPKTIFDPDDGTCIPGFCPNNMNNLWVNPKTWK